MASSVLTVNNNATEQSATVHLTHLTGPAEAINPDLLSALKRLSDQDNKTFVDLHALARKGHTPAVRAYLAGYGTKIKTLEAPEAAVQTYPDLPETVAKFLIMREIGNLKNLIAIFNPSQPNYLEKLNIEAERRMGILSDSASQDALQIDQEAPKQSASEQSNIAEPPVLKDVIDIKSIPSAAHGSMNERFSEEQLAEDRDFLKSTERPDNDYKQDLLGHLKTAVTEQKRLKELNINVPSHLGEHIRFLRQQIVQINDEIAEDKKHKQLIGEGKPGVSEKLPSPFKATNLLGDKLDDLLDDHFYRYSFFKKIGSRALSFFSENILGKAPKFSAEEIHTFEKSVLLSEKSVLSSSLANTTRKFLDRLEDRASDIIALGTQLEKNSSNKEVPAHLAAHEEFVKSKIEQFRPVYERQRTADLSKNIKPAASRLKHALAATAGSLLVALGLGIGASQNWDSFGDNVPDNNAFKAVKNTNTIGNVQGGGTLKSESGSGEITKTPQVTTPSGVASLDWALQQPGADAQKLILTADIAPAAKSAISTVKVSKNFGNVAYSTLDTPIVETGHEEGKFESRFGTDTYARAMAYVNAQKALFPNVK